MMQQLKAYDFGLAALMALVCAALGFYALSAVRAGVATYETDLLALSATDAALNRDLERLESGALQHYDSLVGYARDLRQIENRLNREPSGIRSAPEFSDLRVNATILLGQKLDLLEDYKTALAAFKSAMDYFPELSANRGRYADAGMSADQLADLLGKIAMYVQEPSPALAESLREGLVIAPAPLSASTPDLRGEGPAPGHAAGRIRAMLDTRQHLELVSGEIAGVPLAEVSAQLTGAYTSARRALQRETQVLFCGGLAALILLFAVLAFIPRWQLGRKEVAAVRQEETLRAALQEARAQSAYMKRDEQEAAARLAEERHIALVRHAFDVMAIVSRQDHYIYVTPACHALYGLRAEDLIGKSVYEGIHRDDLIKVQDFFARAQKELQMDQTIHYRVMDAFGKWHLVESFASNQATNPAVRGMVLNTRHLRALGDKAAEIG